jgi:hypothetical protein
MGLDGVEMVMEVEGVFDITLESRRRGDEALISR